MSCYSVVVAGSTIHRGAANIKTKQIITKIVKKTKIKIKLKSTVSNNNLVLSCLTQDDHSPDNVKFPAISLTVRGTPPWHLTC